MTTLEIQAIKTDAQKIGVINTSPSDAYVYLLNDREAIIYCDKQRKKYWKKHGKKDYYDWDINMNLLRKVLLEMFNSGKYTFATVWEKYPNLKKQYEEWEKVKN